MWQSLAKFQEIFFDLHKKDDDFCVEEFEQLKALSLEQFMYDPVSFSVGFQDTWVFGWKRSTEPKKRGILEWLINLGSCGPFSGLYGIQKNNNLSVIIYRVYNLAVKNQGNIVICVFIFFWLFALVISRSVGSPERRAVPPHVRSPSILLRGTIAVCAELAREVCFAVPSLKSAVHSRVIKRCCFRIWWKILWCANPDGLAFAKGVILRVGLWIVPLLLPMYHVPVEVYIRMLPF